LAKDLFNVELRKAGKRPLSRSGSRSWLVPEFQSSRFTLGERPILIWNSKTLEKGH
jgi:hypothetical protein